MSDPPRLKRRNAAVNLDEILTGIVWEREPNGLQGSNGLQDDANALNTKIKTPTKTTKTKNKKN
jgi:hypothetical protein